MKIQLLLIISCVLSLSTNAFSQSYAVTIKGDTLYGTLSINNTGTYELVELIEASGKKSYTALEVKAALIDGDTYHSIRYGGAFRFLKLIQIGYVSIYGYRIENLKEYNGRLLVKKDGTTMDVPTLQFRKALRNYLRDCERVVQKLKSKEWGSENLNEIVDDYNWCLEEATEARFRGEELKEELNQKLPLIIALRKKINTAGGFPEKADTLELLADIQTNIETDKKIPNYQIYALREYLSSQKSLEDDLNRLLAVLR